MCSAVAIPPLRRGLKIIEPPTDTNNSCELGQRRPQMGVLMLDAIVHFMRIVLGLSAVYA